MKLIIFLYFLGGASASATHCGSYSQNECDEVISKSNEVKQYSLDTSSTVGIGIPSDKSFADGSSDALVPLK